MGLSAKKKARKRPQHTVTSSSGESDGISNTSSDILEVEKILAKKMIDGKPLYLLRWKNYDSSEDTWEPPENLGCPDLLEEFELALKTATENDITRDEEPTTQADIESNTQTDKRPPAKPSGKGSKKPKKHKYQELQHDSVALNDDDPFPTQVPVSKQSNDSLLEASVSNMSAPGLEVNGNTAERVDAPASIPNQKVKPEPKIFLDSDESALERDIASSVNEPCSSVSNGPTTIVNGVKGFQRGCEPERILGATETGGSLKFLMKWKNCTKVDLVTAEEAGEKCPKLVIDFYVKHLTWSSAGSAHP